MMKPVGHRQFWVLFGLSMALHAVLFAATSWQRQPAPLALPTILASIRLVAVSPSESGSAAAAAPAPAPAAIPQKARQNPQRAEQRSAPRVTQTAGPANVPAQNASPQVVVAAASGTAVVAPPAPQLAHTPPALPAPRPQSELLDGYRQRLSELLARQHEYPRIAAMRGWEGEVRLRLKVARKGNLLGVQLDRSSGFEVLDQHALAMLETLASLPPLPEALESNEIQVVVPINYRLKKTT